MYRFKPKTAPLVDQGIGRLRFFFISLGVSGSYFIILFGIGIGVPLIGGGEQWVFWTVPIANGLVFVTLTFFAMQRCKNLRGGQILAWCFTAYFLSNLIPNDIVHMIMAATVMAANIPLLFAKEGYAVTNKRIFIGLFVVPFFVLSLLFLSAPSIITWSRERVAELNVESVNVKNEKIKAMTTQVQTAKARYYLDHENPELLGKTAAFTQIQPYLTIKKKIPTQVEFEGEIVSAGMIVVDYGTFSNLSLDNMQGDESSFMHLKPIDSVMNPAGSR